ncbi:hypothetical protein [Thermococcus sp.]
MREPKTSANVLTLILFLGLFSAVYDGNLNINFLTQWALLLGILWLLTVRKREVRGGHDGGS